MATVTPAYSWPVPTSSDLVKDGATAIEALGDAIDASMNTALGTKKAGMVLLNTTSFSGVTAQSVNSVFNATYDNYFIKILISSSAGNQTPTFRLRASGTDSSTNYVQGRIYQNSTTVAGQSSPYGTDEWGLVDTSTAYPVATTEIFLSSPFLSTVTSGNMLSSGADASANLYQNLFACRHTTASSYDGFTIIAASNITGKIYVYGYNQ